MPDKSALAIRAEAAALAQRLIGKFGQDDRANVLAFLTLSADHGCVGTKLRINRNGEVFLSLHAIEAVPAPP